MALIVIPRRVPWRRQPPGYGYRIIRDHPLLKGLLLGASPHGNFEEFVDGSGIGKLVTNRSGPGYDGNISNYLRSPTIVTPSEITLLMVVSFKTALSTANIRQSVAISGTDSGLSPLNFSRNHTDSAFANAWASHNGTSWTAAKYTTVPAAGELVVLSASVKSGDFKIYYNGIMELDSTVTALNGSGVSHRLFVSSGMTNDTTSNAPGDQIINLVLYLDGFKDDPWHAELGLNPWQIFAPRTQRIFIPSGGTKTATLILDDKDSNIVANATGIRWAWFDQMPGSSMAAPTDKGSVETTDASGSLSVDIPNSTLTSGQTGYLSISNSDGTIATNHLQGGGPAKVD